MRSDTPGFRFLHARLPDRDMERFNKIRGHLMIERGRNFSATDVLQVLMDRFELERAEDGNADRR
jgi:hypothetical protein